MNKKRERRKESEEAGQMRGKDREIEQAYRLEER